VAISRAHHPASIPVLRPREFQQFRNLAYSHFGLDLRPGKQSLVASRLGRSLRELGLRSFADYFNHIQSDSSGAALATMVDRLTTNHTSFFREPAHFNFLCNTIWPQIRSRSRIHIWSAACSTGEEPYSIAMSLLEESPREAAAKIKIKATDISTRALAKASSAIVDKLRAATIPPPLRSRYLVPTAGTHLRFNDSIISMIDFHHLNLMASLPAGYRCSIIYCRNVMIYFDRPTQQSLVQRLTRHLEPGGYLFIGHAESLNNISHQLQYVQPSVYRKPLLPSPHSQENL
jgi:chemotaxis protein methyltransferase CheR